MYSRIYTSQLMAKRDSGIGPLIPGCVHVWQVTCNGQAEPDPSVSSVISDAERERIRNIKIPEVRRLRLRAAAVRRILIGSYLNMRPGLVQLETGRFGKPYVVSGTSPLKFNSSHSDNKVMLAFARDMEIGIDIERISHVSDAEGIAQTCYTPNENAELLKLEGDEKQRMFFRIWTRKEAFIKGVGAGLSLPLNAFNALTDDQIRWKDEKGILRNWRIREIFVEGQFVAATAVENLPFDFSYFSLEL